MKDFNVDRKLILEKLDGALSIIREIQHDYKIDVIRNVQYRELAVVELINQHLGTTIKNTMFSTGDDALGYIYPDQTNEVIEIKTCHIKPFGSLAILFDKQEQEDKRQYTLDCGAIAVGMFRPNEVMPVYVMIPKLAGTSRNNWIDLLKRKQNDYLVTLRASLGENTQKWQSISIKTTEIVSAVGEENCSFLMRNGNVLNYQQFKDTFPKKKTGPKNV